jgi:anti-anti-sigma regulatory factor
MRVRYLEELDTTLKLTKEQHAGVERILTKRRGEVDTARGTFMQAMDRVLKETDADIRVLLDAKQVKRFGTLAPYRPVPPPPSDRADSHERK